MSAGGKRTIRVPANLGFGSTFVQAPYGFVPENSDLTYEVRLDAAYPALYKAA